jgi:hypothetical protein
MDVEGSSPSQSRPITMLLTDQEIAGALRGDVATSISRVAEWLANALSGEHVFAVWNWKRVRRLAR